MRNTANRMTDFATLWLALIIVGGIPSLADGGEPGGPGEVLGGPAIPGTVTLTGTEASFVGTCKNESVVLGPVQFVIDLATVTASSMENFRINQAGPPGCRITREGPSPGGENLIINTVIKFTNLGTQVVADVILLYILPRSNL